MSTQINVGDQYYLTRSQYNARKNAGTLVVGAQYYITDEDYLLINNNVAQEKLVANTTAVSTLTDSQVRNITISASEPTSADGNNGDVWFVYTAPASNDENEGGRGGFSGGPSSGGDA